MMIEEAFLLAIHEHPDDDTNRLVYADWLDEQGRARQAEFIRLQLTGVGWLPRLFSATARERELLKRHLREVAGPLGPWLKSWRFDRGLLVKFKLNGDPLGYSGSEALARTPALVRWTTLDLADRRIGNIGAEMLFASPYLARLSRLDLTRNHLGPAAVRALVGSPHLESLKKLVLADNAIGDEGVVILASSPLMGRLSSLDLRGCYLTCVGEDDKPFVPTRLSEPRVSGPYYPGPGVEALRKAAPPSLQLLLDPVPGFDPYRMSLLEMRNSEE